MSHIVLQSALYGLLNGACVMLAGYLVLAWPKVNPSRRLQQVVQKALADALRHLEWNDRGRP